MPRPDSRLSPPARGQQRRRAALGLAGLAGLMVASQTVHMIQQPTTLPPEAVSTSR